MICFVLYVIDDNVLDDNNVKVVKWVNLCLLFLVDFKGLFINNFFK